MKKCIIFILVFVSLSATAQKPWEQLKIDSSTFAQMYGAEFQYKYQHDIERKSSHKSLCLLTGAQYMWMYELSYYMADHGFSVDFTPGEKTVIIEATPKISTVKNPTKLKAVATLNKQYQVVNVSITGPADAVFNLFVNYWEFTGISMNDLKTKRQLVKEFVSDRVAISWTGKLPVISITKNKTAPIDIFPLYPKVFVTPIATTTGTPKLHDY